MGNKWDTGLLCLTCFKPTTSEWYGTYEGGYCRVHFYREAGEVDRVVVSGNDDLSVVYDGEDAEYKFHRILEMEDVTLERCHQLGLGDENA